MSGSKGEGGGDDQWYGGREYEQPIRIKIETGQLVHGHFQQNQIGKNTEGYDDEEHRALSTGR